MRDLSAIEASPHYRNGPWVPAMTPREQRHDRIERTVAGEIAWQAGRLGLDGARMLQLQPGPGQQTLLYRDQLTRPRRPVIYDAADTRDREVREQTDFVAVDFEAARLPAADGHFDLVVWNRELVTVKNALPLLSEVRRILRPGGVLILAVPNLAALHNRLLLLAGRQPSTLHVTDGDHVRGFTSQALTRALTGDLGFQLREVTGVGLAPISGAVQHRALRTLSHTIVWVLARPHPDSPHPVGSHPVGSEPGPA
ncbi:MAG TPA: class I SAM-dependent methyltransferase [Streptosporangiaceae bacterium]|jgi:SAM-dependent methyltransferase